MKIKIERLEYPEIEKDLSPYYESHGVRLYVYIKDSDKVYEVELHIITDNNIPLRARYYQSLFDADNVLKGQHYSEFPPSFIIFICTYDPYKHNMPVYSFSNRCQENKNLILNNEITYLFFNATSYKEEKDVAIKSFLQYVCDKEPVDDFTKEIESYINKIKKQLV